MIDKLLVAVDGSKHSLKAIDYASEIASSLDAEVIVLYVLKSQELPKGLREYANLEHIPGNNLEILKSVAKNLVNDSEQRARDNGATKTQSEVEVGPIARTIVARAKHHQASMIVIGSRGLGNVEATLRGGVSHRVELLANCPVLTVR